MSPSTLPVDRRADRVWALLWIAFGVAVLVESLRMDRLAHMGINRFTVPGIVPGMLGVALLVLGGLLLGRAVVARRATATAAAGPLGAAPSGVRVGPIAAATRGRFAVGSLLFAVYALAMFGHLPFPVATFAFVTGFIGIAEWHERGAAGKRLRGIAFAAVCGAATAGLVTYVFQYLFLVQLP
jgi:hypothetical protein